MPGYTFPLDAEEDIGDFELSGDCTVWESVPENKTKLIRSDQVWGVDFKWRTSGGMAGSLDGKWTVHVYLERMGPAEAPAVTPEDETYYITHLPHEYNHRIRINAGTVPVGLYKLATAITMRGRTDIPTPIAMLGDGPLIQVYKVP